MIRITSRRAGFRRCGIAHPDTPVDYPAGRFSADELERLKAEPMLEVVVTSEHAPVGAITLRTRYMVAIAELVAVDPDHTSDAWTKQGKPGVRWLRLCPGLAKITAGQADAYWREFSQMPVPGEGILH